MWIRFAMGRGSTPGANEVAPPPENPAWIRAEAFRMAKESLQGDKGTITQSMQVVIEEAQKIEAYLKG